MNIMNFVAELFNYKPNKEDLRKQIAYAIERGGLVILDDEIYAAIMSSDEMSLEALQAIVNLGSCNQQICIDGHNSLREITRRETSFKVGEIINYIPTEGNSNLDDTQQIPTAWSEAEA